MLGLSGKKMLKPPCQQQVFLALRNNDLSDNGVFVLRIEPTRFIIIAPLEGSDGSIRANWSLRRSGWHSGLALAGCAVSLPISYLGDKGRVCAADG